MTNQVEHIHLARNLVFEVLKNNALLFKLPNQRLLLIGLLPFGQKVVQRGIFLAHTATGIIFQVFRDQLPVGVCILHPFIQHTDIHTINVILAARFRHNVAALYHGVPDRLW